MKIFVYAHLDEPAKAFLQKELSAFDVYWADKHNLVPEDRAQFAASEICFGNVPATWLKDAPKLRWMQLESVGFEYYQKLQGEIAQSGIVLTNLRGMFAWPAAETALAGLLALIRGVDEMAVEQRSHNWISLDIRPRLSLLHGRKILILGMGSIGRQVGALLRAFECDVHYFARTAVDASFRTVEELDARLNEFAVIVNCLPSTPETTNFFSRERLARFSQKSVFVNVGRGSAVDEAALVELLQSRKIGGAILDVFKQEPLPSDHPFWDCPRTILLQHTGGGYDDELLDKARTFFANLNLYQKQQPLQNLINLERGY